MTFENDLWKDDQWAMPQRIGPDVGGAQEFAMQSVAGGYQGIKTVEFVNHNGSVTTLRNRNGWPEFETSEVSGDNGESAVLYCRMMSDLYPRGAEVERAGGSYTTQNGARSWPTYPTSKGEIGKVSTYPGNRAEPAVDYPDSQGSATWYDTRPDGSRQFNDVLSWADPIEVGFSDAPQKGTWVLKEYYTQAGLTNNHTYFSPNGNKTAALGDVLPGHRHYTGTRDFRYTERPVDGASLYKNGVTTGISGRILGACMVDVSGGTRFRILTMPYELYTGQNIGFSMSEYDEAGVELSYTGVALPAGLLIRNLLLSPRWNSSGTQAACAIAHVGSDAPALNVDVLLINSDGSSSLLADLYGAYNLGNISTRTQIVRSDVLDPSPGTVSVTTNASFTTNRPVSIDYVGDDLRILRREDVLAHTSSDITNYTIELLPLVTWELPPPDYLCTQATYPIKHGNGGTRYGTTTTTLTSTLILEPGGAQVAAFEQSYSGDFNLTYTSAFEQYVYGVNGCGEHTTYRKQGANGEQANTESVSGEGLVRVVADLRKGMVFALVATGSYGASVSATYTPVGTAGSVNFSRSRSVSSVSNGKIRAYENGGFFDVTSVSNISSSAISSFSSGLSPAEPIITSGFPYASSSDNTVTTTSPSGTGFGGVFESAGALASRYRIQYQTSRMDEVSKPVEPVYFSAAISKDGKKAVVSWVCSKGLTYNYTTYAPITISSLAATTKWLSKGVSGPWKITELSLPTYDGTVKWVGEPLILTEQT